LSQGGKPLKFQRKIQADFGQLHVSEIGFFIFDVWGRGVPFRKMVRAGPSKETGSAISSGS
jgi:hypothetical protein